LAVIVFIIIINKNINININNNKNNLVAQTMIKILQHCSRLQIKESNENDELRIQFN